MRKLPFRRTRPAVTRKRSLCRRHLSCETLEHRRLLAGDAVMDWNAIALEAVRQDSLLVPPDEGGPTRAANALAVVHIAMYDAVNAIDGAHMPYLYHASAPKTASMEAAVAAAAHATLVALWPQQKAALDTAYVDYLDGIEDGLAEDQGVALGNATAGHILMARKNDGSLDDMTHEMTPGPGHHDFDPMHPGQGVLTPKWGAVKPFAMASGDQFRMDPPPALDSAEYAAAFNEVKELGAVDSTARTEEQTEIGLFWAYDGAKGLGTPPRLYNQIVRTIAEQQGNTMVENARLFALVNIAQADAGIAAWETKYIYDFWRPVVAIRNGDGDGNDDTLGDPNWRPLGAPASNSDDPNGDFTPPFPAYTSGHATFGAATFHTLELFYGTDDISFDFTSDELNGVNKGSNGQVRPLRTRHFDSFSEAMQENALSRIYLGIHWIFDATAGMEQGTEIADHVFANMLAEREAPLDPVLDWNWIALETMRKDSMLSPPDIKGPTEGSLALGYVHTAIYDAVNAIDRTHTRYLYEGKGAQGANMDAAVAVAAHTTLAKLFPSHKSYLDAELQAYLAAIPDHSAEVAGIGVGWGAAHKLLDARENDGRDLDMSHDLVDGMGHHQPDPLHPTQGLLSPKWGEIQPFAMTSGDQFRMSAPPALNSDEYAAAFNEVKAFGAIDSTVRTPEQTEIGLFWAYDGPPNLSTPPRLYNQIVRAIAEQQGNSVVENARLFALVNIAMADAGIASWDTKYAHDFWRPIIGIRNGDADGNPATEGDSDWRPLGAPASNTGNPDGDFTPPFPAYTSGHATFGGAVFRTLELFYGTDDVPFMFQSDEMNGVNRAANGEVRHPVTRKFDSFSEAMEENAQSRIYLGIHWQFDATEGMAQGSAIADYVFAHKFRAKLVFENEENAADVNGDGSLSILDVLTEVQQLRHFNATGEMEPGFQGFCDTNGDEQFTIGDLLGVVQAIRGDGDGEEGSLASAKPAGGPSSQAENETGESASALQLVDPDFGVELIVDEEPVDEAAADPNEPTLWEGDGSDGEIILDDGSLDESIEIGDADSNDALDTQDGDELVEILDDPGCHHA